MVEVFISCAIHTEKLVLRELEEVLPFTLNNDGTSFSGPFEIIEVLPGGIRLNLELIHALQLNYWLRTANRVLIRLAQFKAGPWPEIREKLKKVELKSWLGDARFELQVDAERCKTSNEKYLRKMCGELWKVQENADQKIFLRGQNDAWTLSLDSTGEHLHRRGVRTKIGEAPIRETLAALTLRILSEGASRATLGKVVLLDPMAGSGTFLVEARDLFSPVRSRSFAFEKWARTPALLKSPSFWKNYPEESISGSAFQQLKAIDIDPKMRELNQELGHSFSAGAFRDFGRRELSIPKESDIWVVTNPPYGRRIEGLDWINEFWDWKKSLNVSKMAVWIPKDLKSQFLENSPFQPTKEFRVVNGGIPCEILFFT